jgi:hypothetical protein
MIILLSNLTVKENRAIAQQYQDINIIIQAGVNSANMSPQLTSNTLTCQTGKQGKQIGIMNINWQGPRWGSKKPELLSKKKQSLGRLLWQIGKYDKYQNPEEDLKENLGQLRAYKNLLTKKLRLEKEITKLTIEVSENDSDQSPSTFKNRFIAMRTDLPDHQEVLETVEEINKQINIIGEKQIKKATNNNSMYIGSISCKKCHLEQFDIWQKSKHAIAYDTLITKKQQFNLDCIICHITGDGDMDQGDAVNLPKNLQGVGCENCHGPGKQHISNPQSNRMKSSPPASICLKCHTNDHDDSFDYETDLIKLQCTK